MAISDRIYNRTDKPMTWTRALVLGTLIYGIAIVLLGQLPSVIIYWVDQNIATVIEWTKHLPGVGEQGLDNVLIRAGRDIVANTVQMGLLVTMLVAAYIWQERKRKRTGGRGLQDTVKGYMSGK